MAQLMAPKKRKLLGTVDAKLVEARMQMTRIMEMKKCLEELEEEGTKVLLVFPGLESSCRVQRPPKEFEFCGRSVLGEIIDQIYEAVECGKNFILTGHKGAGKSSLLRAIVLQLLVVLNHRNNNANDPAPTTRLVCFWYFDANGPLADQVQDALLFTFCNEDEATLKQISEIQSWKQAADFLKDRRREGEIIWLLTDGEERLDNALDDRKRAEARTWLDEICREADFIIKALSPGANEINKKSMFQGSPVLCTLDKILSEIEQAAILEDTVLGLNLEVYPHRQVIVDEIAGYHPLSLSTLINYCNNATGFSKKRVSYHTASIHRELVKGLKSDAGENSGGEKPLARPVAAEPDILLDETSWNQVVSSFKRDKMFKEMRKSVREKAVQKDELASFMSLIFTFPAYVVENSFCTPLIRQIHIEEAGAKMLSSAYANEAWSNYAKERLQDGRGLNWVELGWLCENFVAQAIQAKGLKLAQVNGSVRKIQGLRVVHMQGSEPEMVDSSNWQDGDGALLLPDKYFFKYVDFVVVQMRGGVICIDGGQVTMDPDGHRKTEASFVHESNIRRFVGDVVYEVHYDYLCPERAATKLREVEFKQDKNYALHTASFTECFEGIGVEEKDLLSRLARKRKEVMDKRKEDKKAASAKRLAEMDPAVKRYWKQTDVEFLQKKAKVHSIVFRGGKRPTKETMVAQLLEEKKMEDCGGNGPCGYCEFLAKQLEQRKKNRRKL